MPNLHIAITDEYWFNTLRSLGHIDELTSGALPPDFSGINPRRIVPV
jgi:hypothetical protein